MNSSPDIEKRLNELEIKASFADDLLDQLNNTIYRQQEQIDRLMHEIAALKQQLPDQADTPFQSLRDELPPHY